MSMALGMLLGVGVGLISGLEPVVVISVSAIRRTVLCTACAATATAADMKLLRVSFPPRSVTSNPCNDYSIRTHHVLALMIRGSCAIDTSTVLHRYPIRMNEGF